MKRLILLGVLAAGCSDPVNAEGTYTLSVTNRADGCNIPWTVDQSNSGIHAVMVQSGDGLTADFMDFSRIVLDGLTGAHTFGGNVSGNDLDLVLHGTKTYSLGACTYTYDANLHATLDGDYLEGRVDYTKVGNGSTDCAGINGCISYQDMNGTRPPT